MFGARNILTRTHNPDSAESTWLEDDNNACINTLTSSNSESWWTGRFKGQWDVTKIEILPDKGAASDSLAGAKVYVGNEECGTLPDTITAATWTEVACTAPVTGKNIKIHKDAALLVFCGLKVFGTYSAPDPNIMV